MIPKDAHETLQCIASTEHRASILLAIAESAKDLRDLSEELAIPRTTVRHNIKQLTDAGLITSTLANEYTTTVLGDAAIDGLDEFINHLETASSLQPFLSCIDPAEFNLSLQRLSEAEITAASRRNPFAPSVRLVTVLSEYSIQECYLPVLPPHHNSAAEPVFADDVRIAVPVSLLEHVSERDDALANAIDEAADAVTVLDSETPSLGLLRTDDRAMALAFDDNEKPHALLEGSSDCFYSWVEEQLSTIFDAG